MSRKDLIKMLETMGFDAVSLLTEVRVSCENSRTAEFLNKGLAVMRGIESFTSRWEVIIPLDAVGYTYHSELKY